MVEGPGRITVLLRQWRDGDRRAQDELFESLMPELRKIARACFRGERPGNLLQPTALVNEAFLRLAKVSNVEWQDRGHFLALAARIMRRHLIDQARSRRSVLFLPIEGIPGADPFPMLRLWSSPSRWISCWTRWKRSRNSAGPLSS